MAETSVQKQSNESKDMEERILASFRKLSPKEQKAKVRIAELMDEAAEEEEQEIIKLQEQGMTRNDAKEKIKQELFEIRKKAQQLKEPTEKDKLQIKMKKKPIPQAILRPAEACVYLSMSRTKLHFLSETDITFPRKIHFSSRCVGWRKESLDAWIIDKEKGLK